MRITLKTSLKPLAISLILIIASIIVTVFINDLNRYFNREEWKMLTIGTTIADVSKLDEMPFHKIEKAKTTFAPAESIEGFQPPIRHDVPIPSNSKKANTTVDNLLFAMSFYYRVPEEEALDSSVIVWDPDNGYYLADKSFPEIALARNIRYLLCLKLYQKLYPTTKYFDEDAVRIYEIVSKQLADDHLNSLLTDAHILQQRIPSYLFFDLLELSKLSDDPLIRNAFLKVGEKLTTLPRGHVALVRNNRDRTTKISMFADAAMMYIYGQETNNINLIGDAQTLMDELIEQLWAKKFNLFYTNSTIGQYGGITETFITTEQMNALVNLIRYSQASGDEQLADIAYTVLKSMSDGDNPLFDQQRLGFYRRYNGKSQTPHADFKLSEDHIKYLEAWIRMNILKNGEFELLLNSEYDGYEMLLYDDDHNAIYMSYEMDWEPRPEKYGKPLVSVDSILGFVLITLEDKQFAAAKAAAG